MSVLKCKMCGGTLNVNYDSGIAVCEYCGTRQTISKTNDDVLSNLYNRANNLRLKYEFDKALNVYEKIVEQDDSEAEAHWGIVLCKYGIEYVDDPATVKKIPTCHRTSFDSIKSDLDYQAAIDYSSPDQQLLYEEEARIIDRLQRYFLNIVRNEKPFDVFLCCKETDERGKRTTDSLIADEICDQLEREGFRVFHTAAYLKEKPVQEYEPYIFSALNSARVMLVIGTRPEYFNDVWVKNDWLRFLSLMKKDRTKMIIPCYRDMDIFDLPGELDPLKTRDMSKESFIADVIQEIKAFVDDEGNQKKADEPAKQNNSPEGIDIGSLSEKAGIFLKNVSYRPADEYFDRVSNNDFGKGEAQRSHRGFKTKNRRKLILLSFVIMTLMILAAFFGPGVYSMLQTNQKYNKAKSLYDMGDYASSIALFEELGDYRYSALLKVDAAYQQAIQCYESGDYIASYVRFTELGDYKDSLNYLHNINTDHLSDLLKGVKTGDTFLFGSFEQDNNINNKNEPIEWRILAKEGNRILAISEFALDCQSYNSLRKATNWESCSLRMWLNNRFYDKAFTDSEKEMIASSTVTADANPDYEIDQGNDTKDKVFLLGIKEVNQYLSSDSKRLCVPTVYASRNGIRKGRNGNCMWWLRTAGVYSSNAARVNAEGYVEKGGHEVDDSLCAVRPAIWIEIDPSE